VNRVRGIQFDQPTTHLASVNEITLRESTSHACIRRTNRENTPPRADSGHNPADGLPD
jgi:hypothetical protein